LNIASLAQGISVVHLYSSQLSLLSLNLPTLPEQTKIANFLTAVDDKLTQLKKKKSLLEQYKKGVMQKIFSQELRFKDENGSDFAEWEEKKIKDVFRFKQGVQCGVESQYTEKGDNMQRFIRIIDLTSVNEPIRYIVSPSIEHHIKHDDLFMVRYGTPGLVGYGYEGVIANNLFRIIPVKVVINKFYYFVFNLLNKELLNLASSSTMPALSFGSLEVLSIPEPSLPEQSKIANFLSAIDDKINHCGVQIEKMERWKKGLLQGMFV
jgi:type I restriction enzyme S subunit